MLLQTHKPQIAKKKKKTTTCFVLVCKFIACHNYHNEKNNNKIRNDVGDLYAICGFLSPLCEFVFKFER